MQTNFTGKIFGDTTGAGTASNNVIVPTMSIPQLVLVNGDLIVLTAAIKITPNNGGDPTIAELRVENNTDLLCSIPAVEVGDGQDWTAYAQIIARVTGADFECVGAVVNWIDASNQFQGTSGSTDLSAGVSAGNDYGFRVTADSPFTWHLLHLAVTRVRAGL